MKKIAPVLLCSMLCIGMLWGNGQAPAMDHLTVYFKSGRSSLSQKEKDKIDSAFKNYGSHETISLTGHTDMVGSTNYNNKLSARRTAQVARYLQTILQDAEIAKKSFGESRPLDKSDLAANRRVEISFAKKGNEAFSTDPVKAPTEVDTTIIKKISFEKIYFIPDKAVIDMASFPYVEDLADLLKSSYTTEKLEIRGHVNCPEWLTSNANYMKRMDDLSEARAKEVYHQLVVRGIPAERLTYRGMGNREMVYPEAKTVEEQKKNMRVEIVVRK